MPFIGAFALVSLILFWVWSPLGWIGTILTAWCAYFFRDPPRVTPVREGIVVSPADGRVSLVANAVPPRELDLGERPLLAHLGVHERVRLPRESGAGRRPDRAHRLSRRQLPECRSRQGQRGQRAQRRRDRDRRTAGSAWFRSPGLVARRILCFVREGEPIGVGDRFGMIRFGSRLDVYLPEGARPLVAEGQTAIAGETVIADLKGAEGPRSFKVS